MNTHTKTRVPNNLRECRRKAGLTQYDVMVKLGLKSMDRISKWENGLKMPSVKNLLKLTTLYGIQPKECYPYFTLAKNSQGHCQSLKYP